ncbi:hypothetical protein ACEPAI_1343 [Sanghuangporus weigelae]
MSSCWDYLIWNQFDDQTPPYIPCGLVGGFTFVIQGFPPSVRFARMRERMGDKNHLTIYKVDIRRYYYLVIQCLKITLLMASEPTETRRALEALLRNYTRAFPTFAQPTETSSDTLAVVLLSGSTGAFGSNILAALVARPNVRLVYAVSRPSNSGIDVRERHGIAFSREGIDTALLEDKKVRLIEGDLSIVGFGMKNELFQELKSSITHIIHNGWQVNFNLPVSKFEANIQSVRNLVDFALTTKISSSQPVKLIFISSLGVFRNTDPLDPDKIWPEERLPVPDSALGLGYTEAKWVSENVLDEAARLTALRPTVVRLGQLVGGPGGYWSEREWFAAMIKSSLLFGMLPNVPGVSSWNRSHVAAKAVVDMLDTEERYLHLVHPRPIVWTDLMSIFSRRLRLPIVHMDFWMKVLHRAVYEAEKVASALKDDSAARESMREMLRQNPAARMIKFFIQEHESCKGKPLSPDKQTVWTPLVRCERAVAASRTLQSSQLPQIGEHDVDQWIQNWKRVGFLTSKQIPHYPDKSLL